MLLLLAALAGAPVVHAQPTSDDLAVTTVDILEQQLLLDKSKRVPAFTKVQLALVAHDFRRALDAAKGLEGNRDFLDYFHYLSGEAELGRMRSFIRSGKSATAIAAGESAAYHFVQAQGANPYTTLQRRAISELGEAEILLGDVSATLHRKKKAIDYYENGFQRLSQVNLLVLVPKASIINYAILCDKNKTDICTSWIAKLAPYVGESDDNRVIKKILGMKRPYFEKTTAIPYKIDLDFQAFQKGFGQYLEGKYEDAYGTWRDLLRDFPRTNIKLRTKFWMGRAAQRSNHDANAETLYREVIKELPFSYYALLSSWYGEIEISRMMDVELPSATAETPILTPADVVHVRRAEILIASGVPELAQFELHDIHPATNMPNEFLVYLAALNYLADNHQASFQVLGELSSRGFPGLFSSYGQKLYFPTSRLPLIRDLSKEWKVDPLLVLSIIKQESAFNPEAISVSNAYGLMQIIPPTARELSAKVEIADLFNPTQNIKLGSKYVQQLLHKYKGNVIMALSAYNAGPGNAERWAREAAGSLPPEEVIEMITFKETREYVQNILRNYYWYNRRIKGEALPNLPALTEIFLTAPPHEPGLKSQTINHGIATGAGKRGPSSEEASTEHNVYHYPGRSED
jgi:tetratricopeptide (TPR) repeat protein